MAGYVIDNNIESTVADNPLAAGAVTLNVAAGQGARFPSTFPFVLTIWDETSFPDPTDDSGMEIVVCTGRATDALTITRGAEGTGDVEHALNETVAILITAGMFNAATYGIQTQIDAIVVGSSYFDRTGTVLTTATAGDTLNLLDDQVLALGTSEDAKFIWETADANANCPMIVLPEGDGVNVPVLVLGDASISGQDLGFFDGVTQPLISVIDDDKDSHIDFGFTADDIGVLQVLGSSPRLRCFMGASIFFHNYGTQNTFFGIGSGNLTMDAGSLQNTCVGYNTGNDLITGASGNTLMGALAGDAIDIGEENTCIGYAAGSEILGGQDNTCVGTQVAGALTNGSFNTLIGAQTGNALVAVDNGIALGNLAGTYETAANKLFIDSLNRTNEAGGRIQSLIYGIINADPALQELHFNSKVQSHGAVVATKTDTYVVALDDFGKSIRMNSADAKQFTLPSVGANDDGARLTLCKIGAGQLTIQTADTDSIYDSAGGTSMVNATGETYAVAQLEYCHATTTWLATSLIGTWVTP